MSAFFSFYVTLVFGQSAADNLKLTELYTVDQAARQGNNIDWVKLSSDDEKRRQEVHRMLSAGEVRTGTDYYHAAMVYQHGQTPDDYLLAHVLAVDAISLGSKDARWLSAATLDRYLRSIWQPQIFGTQFYGEPLVQEPINPSIVGDKIRAVVCVVPIAEQQKIVEEVKHGAELRGSSIKGCN
jgi:hypothetical protein